MLLSTAALEKHKDNFNMYKHQTKRNRVKSYITDQQRYIHQYKSPNSSDIGSVPESCENQEPLSSGAFSSSISEIIRRKQTRTEATSSFSIQHSSHQPSFYIQKQPLLHPPPFNNRFLQNPKRPAAAPDESVQEGSSIRHSKRHKSTTTTSHASEKIPLQTKPSMIKKASHGMHLLQKFVSPNLEISRITLKPNNKQPQLGIFRKGKSSAQGKPIPDITDFQESIIKRKENIKPTTVVMEDLSHEPPSISKFFSKRPVAQTFCNNTLPHVHHATTIHQDKPKETPRTTPVLSSNYQARRRSAGSPAADTPYKGYSNHSLGSICRLLDECQEMNQYLTPNTNGPYYVKPNYSPVKTPHSFFQATTTTDHTTINTVNNKNNLSFLGNSKLPHPLYPSLAHRSATPRIEPEFSPPLHYNSDTHASSYHDTPPPDRQKPMMQNTALPPTLPDHKFSVPLSVPLWQVTESVTSLAVNTAAEEHAQLQQEKVKEDDDHTTTANDDLELILQSRAMNMLGESIQQNDDTVQSFWLRQPGFTTRDH